uniref:Uncharacterized protein n=1 Tax=Strongyloides venezuelensis TaxID=75913 RepID=A0A0K0F5S0_STRVS
MNKTLMSYYVDLGSRPEIDIPIYSVEVRNDSYGKISLSFPVFENTSNSHPNEDLKNSTTTTQRIPEGILTERPPNETLPFQDHLNNTKNTERKNPLTDETTTQEIYLVETFDKKVTAGSFFTPTKSTNQELLSFTKASKFEVETTIQNSREKEVTPIPILTSTNLKVIFKTEPSSLNTKTSTLKTETSTLKTKISTLRKKTLNTKTSTVNIETSTLRIETSTPMKKTSTLKKKTLSTKAPILNIKTSTSKKKNLTLSTKTPTLSTKTPTLNIETSTLKIETLIPTKESPILKTETLSTKAPILIMEPSTSNTRNSTSSKETSTISTKTFILSTKSLSSTPTTIVNVSPESENLKTSASYFESQDVQPTNKPHLDDCEESQKQKNENLQINDVINLNIIIED